MAQIAYPAGASMDEWYAWFDAATAESLGSFSEKRERVQAESTESEAVAVDADRLRELMVVGGRAVCTVRSHESGRHVTIRLTAKKKKPGGKGWLSRAAKAGRVGTGEADTIFADDPSLEFAEARLGSLDLATGTWRDVPSADPSRVWAANRLIRWMLGAYPLDDKADVFVATECAVCGRPLTDPESIERGIGPECWGRHTKSKQAERQGGEDANDGGA